MSVSTVPARSFAIVLAVLALTGCAGLGQIGKTPEERVMHLANERWKTVIAGDVEKAYSFLSPSYRAVVGLDRYRASFGSVARRESAEVVGVTCEAERCKATVRVDFKLPIHRRGAQLNTHVTEDWVLEDGRWWYYQRL